MCQGRWLLKTRASAHVTHTTDTKWRLRPQSHSRGDAGPGLSREEPPEGEKQAGWCRDGGVEEETVDASQMLLTGRWRRSRREPHGEARARWRRASGPGCGERGKERERTLEAVFPQEEMRPSLRPRAKVKDP